MRLFRGKTLLEIGGYAAGLICIGFGVGAIVMGANGISTVRDNLAREQIEGTGETSLDGFTIEEGELVNTGSEARAFADLMRTHALEGTGGRVYAEMGRFLDVNGGETNDPGAAAQNPDGTPVQNGARQTWVTQTALATALNMAYFGERVAVFGIVVGIALLLAGIGFVVLAASVLHKRRLPLAPAAPPVDAFPPAVTAG